MKTLFAFVLTVALAGAETSFAAQADKTCFLGTYVVYPSSEDLSALLDGDYRLHVQAKQQHKVFADNEQDARSAVIKDLDLPPLDERHLLGITRCEPASPK